MTSSLPQLRRRNLLLLLSRFTHEEIDAGRKTGAATAFAQRIGVHKSLLSKLTADRNISDAMARQIEANLGVEAGWMDAEHEDAPLSGAELSLQALVVNASRATDAKGRTQLRRLLKAMAEGHAPDWSALLPPASP